MDILLVSPKDSLVDFLGIYSFSPQDVFMLGWAPSTNLEAEESPWSSWVPAGSKRKY